MTSIEMPPLERKLVAVLAADFAGYSRLMHEDEESALHTLSGHREIIDNLIALHRGQISGTAGDSVLAEFASVADAVNCAVSIQKALIDANAQLDVERRMELRIGINVGDVMVKDGGIFGDGVNVAARLEALAEPAGICVTRGVRDHLRDRMEYSFEDTGEHHVKNIARPVRVFRVLLDDIGPRLSVTEPSAPRQEDTSRVPDPAIELAFWQSVEASNNPAEYAAYLELYPEGTFVPLAHARLAMPSKRPDAEDRDVELAFWESIRDSDDVAMFNAYVEKFPAGEFLSLASLNIAALSKE